MTDNELSRRQVMQLGLGAAATAGLVSTGGITLANASEVGGLSSDSAAKGPSSLQTSVSNAYLFLNQMMDAYAQGPTIWALGRPSTANRFPSDRD